MTGTLKRPMEIYFWNMGYSLCLGLPLFANGILFGWFEKRYIDWIKRPMKSVLIAISIHIIYSSIIIFFVNWFWYVIALNQKWESFMELNKGMIISEYIIFIIVASIIYAISFFRAWRHEVRESEKIKREALSLKYQVLQNQVNPHFLFNSLNILGSLIDIDVLKAKHLHVNFHCFIVMFYILKTRI